MPLNLTREVVSRETGLSVVRCVLSVVACHLDGNFCYWQRTTDNELLQRIDYQAAEELGIEVSALGGHAFAVAGDGADVLDGGGHY